jgi:phosphatidylserine/phosphatidylglycerophosphate/cardiolipin synthase-like enzyme
MPRSGSKATTAQGSQRRLRAQLTAWARPPNPPPLPAVAPAQPPERSPARYLWALLLARIYELLPLRCTQCGGEMIAGEVQPAFEEHAKKAGETLVQIVAGTPKDAKNEIYVTLLSVLTYAQKSVDITMAYVVSDDALEKAISDAPNAASRCASSRPRAAISPAYSTPAARVTTGCWKAACGYSSLRAPSCISRALWSMVCDRRWARRMSTGAAHNYVISVCVIDEGFARVMRGAFDADLAESRASTLDAWRDRGFAERLKELLWLPLQYWL